MVALGITYFANNSCYYLLELEGYEIDNLKIQISFDALRHSNFVLKL